MLMLTVQLSFPRTYTYIHARNKSTTKKAPTVADTVSALGMLAEGRPLVYFASSSVSRSPTIRIIYKTRENCTLRQEKISDIVKLEISSSIDPMRNNKLQEHPNGPDTKTGRMPLVYFPCSVRLFVWVEFLRGFYFFEKLDGGVLKS
jgi:hypothetical protein